MCLRSRCNLEAGSAEALPPLASLTCYAVCEFSFHINTGFNPLSSKARHTWQPNPELTYGQV